MLKDAVDDCARGLIAAGAKRGDRIATLTVPGPDFLVTFLATASVGCIWVGLNPRYTNPELTHLVDRISQKLLFSRAAVGERHYGPWPASLMASFIKLLMDVGVRDRTAASGTPSGEFLR